jgi:hypothetical protein
MPANVNSETTIYGQVKEGIFKADSMKAKGLTDTAEKKISQMMNAIQNKVKFPDHPLHVGDTFTQEVPINIPMAESNGEITIKATYKLVSIADGNAYFDINQDANMQMNIKGASLTISGVGAGKMVFSMKNSFPSDYTTALNLKVDAKVNTLIVKGTMVINGTYKYTIN